MKIKKSKISRILQILLTLIKNSRAIRSLANELIYKKEQLELLNSFGLTALNSVAISDFFSFLNDKNSSLAITTDFSTGISPVNDYYLLCRIARALKIKKYFEIGTWLGLSAKNIASTMKNETSIYSLDLPFDHPEISIFNIPTEIFGHYSKGNSEITLLKSDSRTFDFEPYKNSFDLVFVDGNHSPEYVESDSINALSLLKNENSILVWHDYMLLGDVNKDVLCGILKAIPLKDHKHLIHLQQSNLALYSKSFNFPPKDSPKWEIPDTTFKLDFNLG